MKRMLVLLSVLTLWPARVTAYLVPKDFSDDPPIQKLTHSYLKDTWGADGFGQCAGIAVRMIARKTGQGTNYYLWAIADEKWDGVAYGVQSETDGEREVETVRRYGAVGSSPGALCVPRGVAIDTVCYGSEPDYIYAYVAEEGNHRVTRLRFDWEDMEFAYYDTLDVDLLAPSDVDCITEPSGTVLVTILDGGNNRLLVFRVDDQLDYELLAAYGTRGSGVGEFWRPSGICVCPGPSGSYYIYVADVGNDRLVALAFDPVQGFQWLGEYGDASAGFYDLSTNGNGYVYATAKRKHAIYALTQALGQLCYVTGDELSLQGPRGIASIGDELAVTEDWTDSTGVQYLRIVPEVEILEGGGLFDATTDSSVLTFRLEELDAHVDVDVVRSGVVRHLMSVTLTGLFSLRSQDGPISRPGGL